jgi:hypothetical protein
MRILVLALLLTISLGSCGAQSAVPKPVEPAAIGEAFRLDASNQALLPLPNEQWKAKGKVGWIGSTGVVVLPGDHSAFRIKAGEITEFVFKTEHPESVRIYPFTLKKNDREYALVVFRGRSRETLQGVPVEITKFGESSYKLTSKSPLASGEYAIDLAGKLYSFGVD